MICRSTGLQPPCEGELSCCYSSAVTRESLRVIIVAVVISPRWPSDHDGAGSGLLSELQPHVAEDLQIWEVDTEIGHSRFGPSRSQLPQLER